MSTHDTHTQYKLRMPPELRDKLKSASEENHRSMNAEILARLQESFDKEKEQKAHMILIRNKSIIKETPVDQLPLTLLTDDEANERMNK